MNSLGPSGSAVDRGCETSPGPPLVVHVIHELGVGGLENGLVNLINTMPPERYRHAIVCMTRHTEFRNRIRRPGVAVYAMHRGDRPLWHTYRELFRLFRSLRPAILHSRNLSGLDALLPGLLAGVRVRIHGEHGRDVDDLDGTNASNRRLRRLFRPFVTHHVAVSRELAAYLVETIGVSPARLTQIYNGVDTDVFSPGEDAHARDLLPSAAHGAQCVIVAVGRLQPVKDHVSLVRAFAHARQADAAVMKGASLMLVGEGPCRAEIESEIARLGVGRQVLLLGARDDVAELYRASHLFVLPSLAEGISNTILEAMASGLPVLATRVGGNADLVEDGVTGRIVKAGDWCAMAQHILSYCASPDLRRRHGAAGRERVRVRFSLQSMMRAYLELYDERLATLRSAASGACGLGAAASVRREE